MQDQQDLNNKIVVMQFTYTNNFLHNEQLLYFSNVVKCNSCFSSRKNKTNLDQVVCTKTSEEKTRDTHYILSKMLKNH